MKKAFTVLELLLVLSILTVLFAVVLFNVRPEDFFETSDTVKIANDKIDLKTAYTKYKVDNEGDVPFDQGLIPGVVYRICKEAISDCDINDFEVSLNELKNKRLLKEIPVHPLLETDRHTGYVLSETGGTELNVIEETEVVYDSVTSPAGECFTFNSLTYCVVEGGDGSLWLDRNIGALQEASSTTDSNSYGYLYQWGRSSDGHQIRTSEVDSTSGRSSSLVPSDKFLAISDTPFNWFNGSNPDNLWQGVSGINNPCPTSWRIPTEAEWAAEMSTWSSQNSSGAFGSSLKLTLTGRRNNSGTLQDVGTIGHYWSYTNNPGQDVSKSLRIASGSATSDNNEERVEGLVLRCIKETEINVIPPSGEDAANYNVISDSTGECTGDFSVNGTYNMGQALGITHTVTLPVFVASLGNYAITTDTINGYGFSSTGTFTETGNTTINLNNNGGTPLATGTDTFTATASGISSTCRFDVEVGDPLPCSTISVPNTPSGPTSVTNGTGGHVYTVSAVSGASSYEWNYSGSGATITAGTNTNSITVSYAANASSGAWTVRAINSNTPSGCSPTYTTGYSSGLNVTNGAPPTTVVASTASTTYSTSNLQVNLGATLSSALGTVNAGTVTFQLKNSGGTNIGTAVTSGTVSAGSASVTYTIPAGTSAASYNIHAIYNPSGNFGLGQDTDATLEFTINKANQTALGLNPNTDHNYNTSRVYTVTGGSGTGAVSDSLLSGNATRTATLTYTANASSGTYVVRLTKAADTNYNARTDDITITMVKANQAIVTVSASPNPVVYPATSTLTAGGGSGTGAYSYAIVSGPGTLAGNVVTPTGIGTIVVNSTKAADTNYNSATSTNLDLVVNAPPCSSVAAPGTPTGATTTYTNTTGNIYNISAVSGADYYEWDYTGTGDTISSGQGTTSITVTYSSSATPGSWRVRTQNNNSPSLCSPTYTSAYGGSKSIDMWGYKHIYSLDRNPEDLLKANNVLYIAGRFTNLAGDADADYIARWNSTSLTWEWPTGQTLGGGSVIRLYDLTANAAGTNVYAVGGGFTNAGGDPEADRIAMWNGSSWSWPTATNVNGDTFALTSAYYSTSENKLYVGGTFFDINGLSNTWSTARFNLANNTWESYYVFKNDDFDSSPAEFAHYNGVLHFGGYTTMLGSQSPGSMGRLNGTNLEWPAGQNINWAYDFHITSGNTFYVSGNFTNAGGDADADNLAIWNGSSFSLPANMGLPGSVTDIYEWGGSIYIVGTFTNAGGDADADYIARWNGTSWEWHPGQQLPITGMKLNNFVNGGVDELAVMTSSQVMFWGKK